LFSEVFIHVSDLSSTIFHIETLAITLSRCGGLCSVSLIGCDRPLPFTLRNCGRALRRLGLSDSTPVGSGTPGAVSLHLCYGRSESRPAPTHDLAPALDSK